MENTIVVSETLSRIHNRIVSFTSRLQEQLKHHFSAGDSKGVYQRSADFSFKHYKDAESLEIIYSVPKWELTEARPYITGPVFKYLENNIE